MLAILFGFERDMQFKLILDLDEVLFREASDIIIRFGSSMAIETYDAIYLACCYFLNKNEETIMVSSDKIICKVAGLMGMDYVNPTDIHPTIISVG